MSIQENWDEKLSQLTNHLDFGVRLWVCTCKYIYVVFVHIAHSTLGLSNHSQYQLQQNITLNYSNTFQVIFNIAKYPFPRYEKFFGLIFFRALSELKKS